MIDATTSAGRALAGTAAALVAARLARLAALTLAIIVGAQIVCLVALLRRGSDRATCVDSSLVRPMTKGRTQ